MDSIQPLFLEIFIHNCKTFHDKPACGRIHVGDTDVLTYRDLANRSISFAGFLQSHCKKGDRVIILAETGHAFVVAFFGCLLAGVIAVPCHAGNPKKSQLLLNVLSDCEASIVIGIEKTLNKFKSVFPEGLKSFSVDSDTGLDPYSSPHLLETDIAFLQYTSGTTSKPKGVMVTFSNLRANLEMLQGSLELDSSIKVVTWLPFYHDMGLVGMLLEPIYLGGTVYYMSPEEFVQRPIRWLKALSYYKATATGAPNFAFDHCVNRIKHEQCQELDLSNLKILISGSEPIRYRSLNDFHEKFSRYNFHYNALHPCYGMAEVALMATAGHVSKPMATVSFSSESLISNEILAVDHESPQSMRMVGCGFPNIAQGAEVVIVDPETKISVNNKVGEIWISGPHTSAGYWNKEDKTNEIFKARLKNQQDKFYLRTGDLGFMHDGELYINGRIKNLIIIGGRNIHSRDVEISVNESRDDLRVGRCAAFSIISTEVESLIVVKEIHRSIYRRIDDFKNNVQRNKDISILGEVKEMYRSIQKGISENLGILALDVVFVPMGFIPVTTSGKIRRQECRKMYENESLSGCSISSLLETKI